MRTRRKKKFQWSLSDVSMKDPLDYRRGSPRYGFVSPEEEEAKKPNPEVMNRFWAAWYGIR